MQEKLIFEYWLKVMDKNPKRAILNEKRKKAIKARLKEGYTAEGIMEAIDGCKLDPFSMGQNNRGKAYNDIELICRDGSKLEHFQEFNVPIVQVNTDEKRKLSHTERASRDAEELLALIEASENSNSVLGNDEQALPQQVDFCRRGVGRIQGRQERPIRELPILVPQDGLFDR